MSSIVLYGTLGCHLCEEADAWLQHFFKGEEVTYVDISIDSKLVERYGLRIPVISNGVEEVDWPFEESRVAKIFAMQVPTSITSAIQNSKSASEQKSRRTFLVGQSK